MLLPRTTFVFVIFESTNSTLTLRAVTAGWLNREDTWMGLDGYILSIEGVHLLVLCVWSVWVSPALSDHCGFVLIYIFFILRLLSLQNLMLRVNFAT